jgi:hypothetical protein
VSEAEQSSANAPKPQKGVATLGESQGHEPAESGHGNPQQEATLLSDVST